MHPKNEATDKDKRLADFADRLLDGKTAPTASSSDLELHSLEQTVLRLTHAFPRERLGDAKAKQMLVRFKTLAKREEGLAVKPSSWKRVFDFHSNPQIGLLLASVAAVIMIIFILPNTQTPGSSVTGSGLFGVNLYIASGLILLLLVIYWLSRRK